MSTVRWAPKNAKTHEASLSENMAQELYERLAADAIMPQGRPTAYIQPRLKVDPKFAVFYKIGSELVSYPTFLAGALVRPYSRELSDRLVDNSIRMQTNADYAMQYQSLGTHAAAFIGSLLIPDGTDLVTVGKATKKVVGKLDDIIDTIPPKVGPRGVMTPPASVAPSGLVPPVAPIRPIEAVPPRSRWPLSPYAEEYVPMPSPTVGPIRNSLRLSDADYQRLVGKPLGINEMLGSDRIVANNFLTPVEQRMAQWLASRAQPRPGAELVLSPRGELVHVPMWPAPASDTSAKVLGYTPRLQLEYNSDLYKKVDRANKARATRIRKAAESRQKKLDEANRTFAEGEAAYQTSVLANTEAAAAAKHKAARKVIDEANARTEAYQRAASAQTRKEMAQRRAEELAKQLDAKVKLEVEAINKAEDEAKLAELNRYADRVNQAEEAYRASVEAKYRMLFGPRHDVAFGPRRAAEARRVAKATKAKAGAEATEATELPRTFWQRYGKGIKRGGAGWLAVGGTAAATQWFTPAARVYQQRLDDAEAKKLSAEVDYLKAPFNKQFRDAYTKASEELKQAKDMSYFWSNVGQGLLKVPMGPIGYANYADQLRDHRRDRAAVSELQKEVSRERGAFVGNAMKDLAARLERATQTAANATAGQPRLARLITHTIVDSYRTQAFREFAKQYSDIDSGLWKELSAAFEEAYKVPLGSYLERQY